MSTCLICPSWSPCKCGGGPTTIPAHLDISRATLRTLSTPVVTATRRVSHAGARQKGAQGEREIIQSLIPIVQKCMRAEGFNETQIAQARTCIQRNQNQSAVGGNDLSHTFGLSFEIKRQEALSVDAWWRQTVAAAAPNNEIPVLVYRQNKNAWSVITTGMLHLPKANGSSYGMFNCRVEVRWSVFLVWFESWILRKLQDGEIPQGVSCN